MLTKIQDWRTVKGQPAEVRSGQSILCAGVVGAVSEDGTTLWIQPYFGGRRVFSKNDSCEIWGPSTPVMNAPPPQTAI